VPPFAPSPRKRRRRLASDVARKIEFHEAVQRDSTRPVLSGKYSVSRLTQIKSIFLSSRLDMRGVSRSSRTLGAGCGGRLGAARRNALEADGEVVWSWRPDAGVKSAAMLRIVACDGGKRARSPRRARRKPLKPFARGRPGRSGEPVVTTLVCFFHFAREAAGAHDAPGFPCALCFGRLILMQTRACRAAGRPSCVCILSSFRGDAKRRTTMCACTSENLEIPGLVLRTIPE
jgi:hypothetical protein